MDTKSYIFYDVDIHYNLIRQKLTLSVSDSTFEHKYENKYDISDIRPYPIRVHPYPPGSAPREGSRWTRSELAGQALS